MLAACQHAPAPTPSTPVSPRWTDGWQPFVLPGKTATVYAAGNDDGRWVLHAKSDHSASMYRRALRIEPDQLGQVSFSWKVPSLLSDADVRESETGDAVVRVMLAFDGDPSRLSARTRLMFDLMQSLSGEAPPFATLMYVWDSRAEVDSVVLNKRSDRIRKIVLESGPDAPRSVAQLPAGRSCRLPPRLRRGPRRTHRRGRHDRQRQYEVARRSLVRRDPLSVSLQPRFSLLAPGT